MPKIKIAIADDEFPIRRSISVLISEEKDMEIVIEAENGTYLIEQLTTIKPDIILMDIEMPEMNGVKATEKINELYPDIKIIILSLYDREEYIIDMNIRGAKSYLSKELLFRYEGKEQGRQEFLTAIRAVHNGGVYMTAKAAKIVQQNLSIESPCPDLTDEQIELLKGICDGQTSKQIGDTICKSPRTVEKHRLKIYKDFGVRNAVQLAAKLPKSLLRKLGVIN